MTTDKMRNVEGRTLNGEDRGEWTALILHNRGNPRSMTLEEAQEAGWSDARYVGGVLEYLCGADEWVASLAQQWTAAEAAERNRGWIYRLRPYDDTPEPEASKVQTLDETLFGLLKVMAQSPGKKVVRIELWANGRSTGVVFSADANGEPVYAGQASFDSEHDRLPSEVATELINLIDDEELHGFKKGEGK